MTFLEIVQALTLIALIIYVILTGRMASAAKRSAQISEKTLQEMKESRAQEVAPYVVPYFDIPYGRFLIYLVVKNVGKSVARNVKLEFEPPLRNHEGEKINEIPMIKQGIASIPPGYEIRTIFDSMSSYFRRADLPLTYQVRVSYSGGLSMGIKTADEILDLSVYKGLGYTLEKGMNDVVKNLEALTKSSGEIEYRLEKIADRLDEGIWLKNADFLVRHLQSEPDLWKSIALAKLTEFETLWKSVYGGDEDKLVNPFLQNLQNECASIGTQVCAIASSAPSNISPKLKDSLLEIVVRLSEMAATEFYADGGASVRAFDERGAQVTDLVNEVTQLLKEASLEVTEKSS
jgi:hypothetical protein